MGGPELSEIKREQILEGATIVFREVGYQRASVDAIAVQAGVSKATIYNHFHDKEALFLATVDRENQAARKKFISVLEVPTGDIEADLKTIGTQLLWLVGSPASVMRFRIVVAEAGRFPDACRSLFNCHILIGRKRMSTFFRRTVSLGLLDIENLEDAAIDFSALCTDNVLRMLHLGIIDKLTEELVEQEVNRATRTFLRAYRR